MLKHIRKDIDKTSKFEESAIREMTRLAVKYNAINLAQGFPDFDTPVEIINIAKKYLIHPYNQYSMTWGLPELRESIANKLKKNWQKEINPDREITITCGASEGLSSAILALVNKNDEVLMFEPYYENYVPMTYIAGGIPKFVRLEPPDWQINWRIFKNTVSKKTKAIIITNPMNPTGKVFSKDELLQIYDIAKTFKAFIITDEVYEYIIYDKEHYSIGSDENAYQSVITVSSASKTFAITGWRVGWVISPEYLTNKIRKVHDYLTVCAPNPFQKAVAEGFNFEEKYFKSLGEFYKKKRDFFVNSLKNLGLIPYSPDGSYYVLVDINNTKITDGTFHLKLVEKAKVSCVPGQSFYIDNSGKNLVRFCFAKNENTLNESVKRISNFIKNI